MDRKRLFRTLTTPVLALGLLAGASDAHAQQHQDPPACTQTFSETGFTVVDGGHDANGQTIRFCSEFKRLGGIQTLGYPVSTPFKLSDGFTYQAFQRAVLQWRPEKARVDLANTVDVLHDAGTDASLAARGIPAARADHSNGDWAKAKAERFSWLSNPAIRDAYLANPNPAAIPNWSAERAIELYGLPASLPERHGPFITQRFQRVVLQLWVEDVPGMPARGTVVGVLSGDLLKEHQLVPAQALHPVPITDDDAYNSTAAPEASIRLWSGKESGSGAGTPGDADARRDAASGHGSDAGDGSGTGEGSGNGSGSGSWAPTPAPTQTTQPTPAPSQTTTSPSAPTSAAPSQTTTSPSAPTSAAPSQTTTSPSAPTSATSKSTW